MMRKRLSIFACLPLLFLLSSCSTTTITEKPGNYRYGVNEEIRVLDIDSRETLATLTVTGWEMLNNQPFVLAEADGTDESGNTVYRNVTYARLIQIHYVWTTADSVKTLSAANFTVRDGNGNDARINPEMEYTSIPRQGNSFVIALQTAEGDIDMEFNFHPLQTTPTARLRIQTS